MRTWFVVFTNSTLDKQLEAKAGDEVHCSKCGQRHPLELPESGSSVVLFYGCGANSHLGAINGRLVVDVPADMSGGYDE